MSEAPRTALVTGASSGIGAATARALGNLGWRVVVAARRVDRLKQVAEEVEAAGGTARVAPLDVRDPEAVDACFAAVEADWGPPDAVISNAGLGIPRLLHEATPEELRRELDTNLLGPMLVARRAIPALVERGAGDLSFVSSANAAAPRTFQAGYSASKAGVETLARVLQMELEGTGVRVSVVRPGPTGSEFGAHYGAETSRRILASWQYWGVMRQLHWMPAEAVARALVTVLTAPPGVRFEMLEVQPENTARGPL